MSGIHDVAAGSVVPEQRLSRASGYPSCDFVSWIQHGFAMLETHRKNASLRIRLRRQKSPTMPLKTIHPSHCEPAKGGLKGCEAETGAAKEPRYPLRANTLILVLCLTTLPLAHADSAKTSLTGPLAERFNAISNRLICQCNCRMILGVCNHQNCPSGIPMRQEIERKLQSGASDEAIVNDFVARIGKVVLSAPPAKGGYLIAWFLPFAALVAGGIWLLRWLGEQNKKRKKAATPTAVLSPEEEEKFKKEWDRWNQR